MSLALVTPPAADIVTLDEVKTHLRVDAADYDDQLRALVATAVARLDGRDGLLGRALLTQGWRLSLPGFVRQIELPLPPCRSVTGVYYTDDGGVDRTAQPASYVVAGIGDPDGAVLSASPGTNWPRTAEGRGSVRIEFTAGYGARTDVPAPIRTAILTHVAHLFETREAVTRGDVVRQTPMGWGDLVLAYRMPGV